MVYDKPAITVSAQLRQLKRRGLSVPDPAAGNTKIDVLLEEESLWLTQQQLADLFQTTKQNISLHLNNIFEEGELQPEATVKEYLTVRLEGSREVRRQLAFYNLDAIIAVGYRSNFDHLLDQLNPTSDK